jgi:lipid-binding SYLF domain-containing protein
MTSRSAPALAAGILLSFALASHAADDAVKEARATLDVFKKADPSVDRFFKTAAGYVVFPTVGKGAIGIGGAGGSGVAFEKDTPIGKASLGQVTIGLALGGQAYSELIFFENAAALTDFKKGNFALAAQASAVALSAGAAATAKYEKGVAIFTITKTGLMYEASVGGQKFGYTPYGKTAGAKDGG